MPENQYPFTLEPLPYAYDALEPDINMQTMQVHHDRLLKAYVEKLNATLAAYPALQRLTLEQMLGNTGILPAGARVPVIRFGGGVYNHNFFFSSLRPGTAGNKPVGSLGKAIDLKFGSYAEFRKAFKEKAMAVFGSGWTWLVRDRRGGLLLEQTANQDTPLPLGHSPLVVVDVWEHAYFLQYLNLRNEYVDNWFNVIDWDKADRRYGAR
jgi:Fe-Mn family superoxide dismutase